jgi:hypothetical protein
MDRDQAFLDGASVCLDLLREPAVARRWPEPSALPDMSVGALACHLARQITRAAELLTTPSTLPPLATVDEHYARAAWVTTTSPDDPANDRTTDDEEARLGYQQMMTRTEADLVTVEHTLTHDTALPTVPLPWQGWSLTRPDFLLTRLLEIVVHSTDLAVSVDVTSPEFPDQVFTPVRDLLVRLAVARHGQAAFISTLTRRERSQNISAF